MCSAPIDFIFGQHGTMRLLRGFVDPTALEVTTSEAPLKEAKGLSLQLNKWLGITRDAGLAPEIRKALEEVGYAKFWKYSGKFEVIHLVCPSFHGRSESPQDAMDDLGWMCA